MSAVRGKWREWTLYTCLENLANYLSTACTNKHWKNIVNLAMLLLCIGNTIHGGQIVYACLLHLLRKYSTLVEGPLPSAISAITHAFLLSWRRVSHWSTWKFSNVWNVCSQCKQLRCITELKWWIRFFQMIIKTHAVLPTRPPKPA